MERSKTNRSHFKRGSGCYTCRECGKRTRDLGDGADLQMCLACYDYAGWENTHSDEGHDRRPDADCPVCAKAKEAA